MCKNTCFSFSRRVGKHWIWKNFYFRKSLSAEKFYHVSKLITLNWRLVKEKFLVKCHDDVPTTDVVYALASKIIDPLQINKTDYEFFKLTHNKHNINKLHHSFDNDLYLNPKIIILVFIIQSRNYLLNKMVVLGMMIF